MPRYPRIDYQYKFCDKSRLKESVYNKRCHHLAALEKSKPHHRHQHYNHHPQRQFDAFDHHHRSNSLGERPRVVYNPFASFENTRVPVSSPQPSTKTIAEEQEEEVIEFVTA